MSHYHWFMFWWVEFGLGLLCHGFLLRNFASYSLPIDLFRGGLHIVLNSMMMGTFMLLAITLLLSKELSRPFNPPIEICLSVASLLLLVEASCHHWPSFGEQALRNKPPWTSTLPAGLVLGSAAIILSETFEFHRGAPQVCTLGLWASHKLYLLHTKPSNST